jgi:beta-lactamase class A
MKKNSLGAMLILASGLLPATVYAGSMASVTGTAQVQSMEDGSGKYMLKSDGFYCLDENGAVSNQAEVHYFDHYEIDGTVFNGYYYHDENGCFLADLPRMAELKNLTAQVEIWEEQEETGILQKVITEELFDGIYMVGNLGRLSAAPQVRYLSELKIGNTTYDGFYYFDAQGRLSTENAIHYVSMTCNGQSFEGYYYFGGPEGALTQQESTTSDGFPVEADGRVELDLDMESLKSRVEDLLSGYEGDWSVYIKDLDSGEELSFDDRSWGSASVIKAFVMASVYQHMDLILENEADLLKKSVDDPSVQAKVNNLLYNMITVSDNESFNELVRLHSDEYDFIDGAEVINAYLKAEGYTETSVQHTLHPSSSDAVGSGDYNVTSVEDCGALLEKIYRGDCVSEAASKSMLDLLLQQTVTWKIPSGLPDGVLCANKTGENDTNQNDIAIIYGEHTTFILCVMTENYGNEGDTFDRIGNLAGVVYSYLDYMGEGNPSLN